MSAVLVKKVQLQIEFFLSKLTHNNDFYLFTTEVSQGDLIHTHKEILVLIVWKNELHILTEHCIAYVLL